MRFFFLFACAAGLVNTVAAGAATREWSFAPGGYWGFRSAPVIHDGRLYIGSLDKSFYCLDTNDGHVVWKSALGGRVTWSGAAVARGIVAVGCEDGLVYALSAESGTRAWTANAGSRIDGPVSSDGERFYVGSRGGRLLALSAADGQPVWTFTAEDEVLGKPLILDGQVYFGAAGFKGKTFYCVDSATGKLVFSREVGGPVYSAPAGAGEAVIFGAQSKRLTALDRKDGTVKWTVEVGGAVFGSPVVVGNTVVFGSQDSKMRGVDAASGKAVWEFGTVLDENLNSPKDANQPIFAENHLSYVPGELKRYYPGLCAPVAAGGDAVFPIAYGVFQMDAATGKLKSRIMLDSPVDGMGVVVDGSSVYVATRQAVEKWRE